jgi:DNA invertase Pin-like site-specific DNA recombinase
MTTYGYARVSTADQSCDVQAKALTAAGCSSVLREQKSGKDMQRPQLQALLTIIQKGDTVVITRLDRLGRSLKDLLTITEDLQARGVSLKVLEQSIDTSNSAGRLFLHVLGAVAEFERSISKERQREGIDAARARKAYKGRPKTVNDKLVAKLIAEGKKPPEIASALNISRASVYRVMGETAR